MHFCPLTCIDLRKHSKIKVSSLHLITMFLESFLPSFPDVYLPLPVVEFLPDNYCRYHERESVLTEHNLPLPND